jgi:cold shock CspA family protein
MRKKRSTEKVRKRAPGRARLAPIPTPVQITFKAVPRSPEIEAGIHARAAKLAKYYPRITGCHVVIASSRRRPRTGSFYSARVDVLVPGAEIVANEDHHLRSEHREPEAAIDQAFRVARRKLEDYARKQRGDVKQRRTLPIGRVSKIVATERYGFVKSPEGREVYFHANALRRGGFDALTVGDPVHYVEGEGDEGPNAASVRPIRRPRAGRR